MLLDDRSKCGPPLPRYEFSFIHFASECAWHHGNDRREDLVIIEIVAFATEIVTETATHRVYLTNH